MLFFDWLFGRRKPLPVFETLAYGSDPLQQLDVYRPANTMPGDKLPVVIMVHGGAWDNPDGDKANAKVIDAKRDHFLAQRRIVVSINYRLYPAVDPLGEARDVAAAVAFVAKLPGVGAIDLMGHSAGAHLAALAVTALWVKVKRVVCLDGIYDVESAIKAGPADLYTPFGSDPSRWPGMSPIDNVHGQEPPFLLCYSTEGPQRKRQADNFAAAVGGTSLGFALSHAEMDAMVGLPGPLTDAIDRFLA